MRDWSRSRQRRSRGCRERSIGWRIVVGVGIWSMKRIRIK